MLMGSLNLFFPFQAGDFVLCELDVEKEKGAKAKAPKRGPLVVHYVGKVQEVMEDGHIVVLYARCNSVAIKDTFYFPNAEDVETLVRSRILGVLTTVKKGETARQAGLIKVFPALNSFNIR